MNFIASIRILFLYYSSYIKSTKNKEINFEKTYDLIDLLNNNILTENQEQIVKKYIHLFIDVLYENFNSHINTVTNNFSNDILIPENFFEYIFEEEKQKCDSCQKEVIVYKNLNKLSYSNIFTQWFIKTFLDSSKSDIGKNTEGMTFKINNENYSDLKITEFKELTINMFLKNHYFYAEDVVQEIVERYLKNTKYNTIRFLNLKYYIIDMIEIENPEENTYKTNILHFSLEGNIVDSIEKILEEINCCINNKKCNKIEIWLDIYMLLINEILRMFNFNENHIVDKSFMTYFELLSKTFEILTLNLSLEYEEKNVEKIDIEINFSHSDFKINNFLGLANFTYKNKLRFDFNRQEFIIKTINDFIQYIDICFKKFFKDIKCNKELISTFPVIVCCEYFKDLHNFDVNYRNLNYKEIDCHEKSSNQEKNNKKNIWAIISISQFDEKKNSHNTKCGRNYKANFIDNKISEKISDIFYYNKTVNHEYFQIEEKCKFFIYDFIFKNLEDYIKKLNYNDRFTEFKDLVTKKINNIYDDALCYNFKKSKFKVKDFFHKEEIFEYIRNYLSEKKIIIYEDQYDIFTNRVYECLKDIKVSNHSDLESTVDLWLKKLKFYKEEALEVKEKVTYNEKLILNILKDFISEFIAEIPKIINYNNNNDKEYSYFYNTRKQDIKDYIERRDEDFLKILKDSIITELEEKKDKLKDSYKYDRKLRNDLFEYEEFELQLNKKVLLKNKKCIMHNGFSLEKHSSIITDCITQKTEFLILNDKLVKEENLALNDKLVKEENLTLDYKPIQKEILSIENLSSESLDKNEHKNINNIDKYAEFSKCKKSISKPEEDNFMHLKLQNIEKLKIDKKDENYNISGNIFEIEDKHINLKGINLLKEKQEQNDFESEKIKDERNLDIVTFKKSIPGDNMLIRDNDLNMDLLFEFDSVRIDCTNTENQQEKYEDDKLKDVKMKQIYLEHNNTTDFKETECKIKHINKERYENSKMIKLDSIYPSKKDKFTQIRENIIKESKLESLEKVDQNIKIQNNNGEKIYDFSKLDQHNTTSEAIIEVNRTANDKYGSRNLLVTDDLNVVKFDEKKTENETDIYHQNINNENNTIKDQILKIQIQKPKTALYDIKNSKNEKKVRFETQSNVQNAASEAEGEKLEGKNKSKLQNNFNKNQPKKMTIVEPKKNLNNKVFQTSQSRTKINDPKKNHFQSKSCSSDTFKLQNQNINHPSNISTVCRAKRMILQVTIPFRDIQKSFNKYRYMSQNNNHKFSDYKNVSFVPQYTKNSNKINDYNNINQKLPENNFSQQDTAKNTQSLYQSTQIKVQDVNPNSNNIQEIQKHKRHHNPNLILRPVNHNATLIYQGDNINLNNMQEKQQQISHHNTNVILQPVNHNAQPIYQGDNINPNNMQEKQQQISHHNTNVILQPVNHSAQLIYQGGNTSSNNMQEIQQQFSHYNPNVILQPVNHNAQLIYQGGNLNPNNMQEIQQQFSHYNPNVILQPVNHIAQLIYQGGNLSSNNMQEIQQQISHYNPNVILQPVNHNAQLIYQGGNLNPNNMQEIQQQAGHHMPIVILQPVNNDARMIYQGGNLSSNNMQEIQQQFSHYNPNVILQPVNHNAQPIHQGGNLNSNNIQEIQ